MSAEYNGQEPLDIAKQAERDLNQHSAKWGHDIGPRSNDFGASDSTTESGVDETVGNKFPGSSVTYGSGASGAGDNRDIPLSDGGDINPVTGKLFKARDYEGEGGPEDKARAYAEAKPGNDDVRGNVR